MKQFEVSTIYSNRISVDPLFLKEGIQYAINHDLDWIYICPLNSYSEYGFDSPKGLDTFRLNTEELRGCAATKELQISEHVKIETDKIEDIYTIPNLRRFSFQDKSFKMDFSKMTQLEALHFKYNDNVKNIGALINLEDLLVHSFSHPNCDRLSELNALKRLRLTGGAFTSLTGVASLKNLSASM
ncbi:MAG: hypothetical protein IPL79_09930 [Myxococcales bacterium]|nr:hypothetical protein [Myxococcales bacterium]